MDNRGHGMILKERVALCQSPLTGVPLESMTLPQTRERARHPGLAVATTILLNAGWAASSLMPAAALAQTSAATDTLAEPPAQTAAPTQFAFSQSPQLIGEISIAGARPSNETIIRRELGVKLGDRFDEQALDKTWDHLEDLGYFAFVDIVTEDLDDDTVAIRINVLEEKTAHVLPIILYDRRQKYFLGGRATDINFRGRGETIDFAATWLRVHRYRLAWTRPWLAGLRDLEAGLSGGWERGRFVYRPTGYHWWDATARVRWYPRRPFYLELHGGFGAFKQREAFTEWAPDRGGGSGGQLLWPAEWRERWLLGGTLGFDSRDLEYYPTRGAFHRVTVQRVTGRGFLDYTETITDLRQFVPLPWKHVLGLRVWSRWVDNPVPVEDRLYWGGPSTIRGISYASLEGEEGYLLTAEYRWPLFLMPISPDGRVIGVGVHVFWDAGDAWYDGGSSRPARESWGVGAHINLATQSFRFEMARTKDGENVFQFEDSFNF